MKLKIEKLLAPKTFKDGSGSDGKPYRLTIVPASGTVDGERRARLIVKAWNGDGDKIADGAELAVKADPKSAADELAFIVVKSGDYGRGGRGGQGGSYRGMDRMQFLLDQNTKLAIAALSQAVEMVKGTDEKAIPLANLMHTWLREKSMIAIEEAAAKGGEA